MQQDFQALPEEAQTLVLDFIQFLKQRYPEVNLQKPDSQNSPYQRFKESGFIGCVEIEEDLSTTYKEVLSEGWGEKYDHC